MLQQALRSSRTTGNSMITRAPDTQELAPPVTMVLPAVPSSLKVAMPANLAMALRRTTRLSRPLTSSNPVICLHMPGTPRLPQDNSSRKDSIRHTRTLVRTPWFALVRMLTPKWAAMTSIPQETLGTREVFL